MKILHVINNLGNGGAENLLVETLPLYVKAGHNITLLQLTSQGSAPEYLDILLKAGVECHSLEIRNLYNPFAIFKLQKYFKSKAFDIIHVHLFPALYWAALAAQFYRHKPILVFTEHNTQNKRSGNPYLQPLERYIYARYDKIITISEAVGTALERRGLNANKITLIRNGVNLSRFENAQIYSDSYWQANFAIPPGAIKLMMTARFRYPKDHLTIIKALSILPESFYLILTGEGDDKVIVEQFVKEQSLQDRVIFAGFRMDIPALMKSVDINILSSNYEGMSGVALEALAAEKPFLGSDVPGINDAVPTIDFLFNCGDYLDLAAKITQLISQDQISNQARIQLGVHQARRYSIDVMAENYLKTYSELSSQK